MITTRRAIVSITLLASVACGPDEPQPPTDADVFSGCELEPLCGLISESDDPNNPGTVANHQCVYEALRDRSVGRVMWARATSLPSSPLVDVFVGGGGRVLRWARSDDGSVVQEVTLRAPEYFSECIAALEQGQWICAEGDWYEGEAVEIEAECLVP